MIANKLCTSRHYMKVVNKAIPWVISRELFSIMSVFLHAWCTHFSVHPCLTNSLPTTFRVEHRGFFSHKRSKNLHSFPVVKIFPHGLEIWHHISKYWNYDMEQMTHFVIQRGKMVFTKGMVIVTAHKVTATQRLKKCYACLAIWDVWGIAHYGTKVAPWAKKKQNLMVFHLIAERSPAVTTKSIVANTSQKGNISSLQELEEAEGKILVWKLPGSW